MRHGLGWLVCALASTGGLWCAEPPGAPPAPKDAVQKEGRATDGKESAHKAAPGAAPQAPELAPMPELTKAVSHVKNIPVGSSKISFGLEHRTRVEVWENKFLGGNQSDSNGLTYLRNRVWMDWELQEHVRVFAMGQDARKDGDTGLGGRTWEDKTDLLEGYLDVRKFFGLDLTVRVGRQPLAYGRERLVGSFEWSNPGRRFDALRVIWKSRDQHWSADAFASKVVLVDAEGFDRQHPTEEFYGLYATNKSLKEHGFDLYALGRINDNSRSRSPTAAGKLLSGPIRDELGRRGELKIGTLGLRAYGEKICQRLDYEFEGAWQFGALGQGEHRAGALHGELGWTFAPAWKPRLMAEFNYGSGDRNPRDGESQAFNNLFPSNHFHYGYIDYQDWSNTRSLGIGFTASPATGVSVWAKGYRFWLDQPKDAWRNAGSLVLGRDRTGRSGRDVGCEFDVGANVKWNRHLQGELGYAIFLGERFVRRVRPGQDESSRFFWAQFGLKF